MFDIGFAELMIIGVVALIVIGPERLPDAVRTASAWLNRIRRGFNDIKQEVQQELHNDAVMKDLQSLRDTGNELRRETQALGSDLSAGLNMGDTFTGKTVGKAPEENDLKSEAVPHEMTEETTETAAEEIADEAAQISVAPGANSTENEDPGPSDVLPVKSNSGD